ncbi:hypothetical protein LTR05_000274, partial [Lithohypha guttulata]
MSDIPFAASVANSSGPAPLPPPKPYSQGQSRSNTPIALSSQSNRNSQQPPVPPHPLHQQSSNQPQHLPAAQHYAQDSSFQHQPHPNTTFQTDLSLPATFELPQNVTKQSVADLFKLLSDPVLLSSLAQLHPSYSASLQPLQHQINANTALATQVSHLERQVKDLRENTGQLMLQHTSLQTQWRRKQTEMDEALAPWGPRAMYQRLLASISEQEAMLVAVQESFMESPGHDHDYYGGSGSKASEKEVTDW